MEKIYKKIFLIERYVDSSNKFKYAFYLLSILPIFAILKQYYFNNGENNLYLYVVISIFSYCISLLFLNETALSKINCINMFFCFIVYSIVVFLPLLLATIGLLSDPVHLFIDILMVGAPYIFMILFFMFFKKYYIYKIHNIIYEEKLKCS